MRLVRAPRRLVTQVLLVQLALVAGVAALVTGLFLAPLGDQVDDEATARALAVAQTTATRPGLPADVASGDPSRDGPVQSAAEHIRRATGARYVVVLDARGVRWSHPSPAKIGRHVSTDPGPVLRGRDVRQVDVGTLGRTARGKAPLRDAGGEVVGAVSVGIDYDSVRARLLTALPGLLAAAGGALAVGALAAWVLARRLRRRTHDVSFADITALLAEREAMLHGIREGVVALDPAGRIRLANDEARRLLDLPPEAVGRPVPDVLGPGRTTDVLTGAVGGTDLVTVHGARVLLANRMPTSDGGAVATLRDRTELERLGRELDGTRGLLEALRAQDHEHANQLHTLLGLLELGLHEEAAGFVTDAVGVHRATAEEITGRIADPLLAALLVGKSAVAAERGVTLRITEGTGLPDRVADPAALVTVLGNLVDNALDAAAGSPLRRVEVALSARAGTVTLRVADSGPGVPAGRRRSVFAGGWSTKEAPAHRGRGLGLPLVAGLVERSGGTVEIGEGPDGGAEFTVVLPEALRPADAARAPEPAR